MATSKPGEQTKSKKNGHLSDDDIKSLFKEINTSHTLSDHISVQNLIKYAQDHKRFGLIHTKEQCEEFVHAADKDGDGFLTFDEFHRWIRDREEFCIKLFMIIDENHHGYITPDDLQRFIATHCNKEISAKEAESLMEVLHGEHEPTGDGRLDINEFSEGLMFSTATEDLDICDALEHASYYLHHDGPTPPASRSLLAGLIAGATSRTLTAPFDRASVVLRAGSGMINTAKTAAVVASPSIVGVLKNMIKNEGLRSLWKGNLVNCLQVGPESALLFYFYNALKDRFITNKESPTTLEKFSVGGVAGFLAMTAVYPLYVTQNRMALAETGRFKGLGDFFRQTIKMDGIKAFGSGYVSSSIRIFPLKGIDLMGYLTLKEIFVKEGQQPTVLQSMSFGATSTFLSQFSTFPLLTIRTKIMTQAPSLGRPIIYTGIADCFRKTVAAEGWKGLYRGHTAQQFKFMPASAIQFTVFEAASNWLKQYF